MTTMIKNENSSSSNTNHSNNNKSIKVKVFYTLRGSKSTLLTTFSISTATTDDLSCIPVPLKTCLWSICCSSPDMICRDHDLSIYTANFHESTIDSSDKQQQQRDALIWEGHGLLTWLMDQSTSNTTANEIQIYGKSNTSNCIDIYIELQPTMKWMKDEYFSSLRNKSFEQFKSSSQTPLHPICNCYNSSNNSDQLLLSSPTPPPPLSNSTKDTEFDRYLRQILPPPPPPPPTSSDHQSSSTSSSPPLPSRLNIGGSGVPVFRPEPIYSASATSTTNNDYNNTRSRINSPPYYNKKQDDVTLPIPSSMNNNSRRSAFTIASTSADNNKYLPTTNSTNSSPSSSDSPPPAATNNDSHNIPVIYTPSNKKRKKNPILMPAAATADAGSSSSIIHNNNNNTQHHHSHNTSQSRGPMYQQPSNSTNSTKSSHIPQQSPIQQQVNTVVRTYYEVDRDNQGAYILPVEIDSWTVVDLGTVIYERPAYHNQRYIYPANYTVRKWYRSMVDPKSDTQYTCRILENGREPKFEVTADDCPMTYSGPTPTTVWTIIVRRAFAIRNQEYGHNPVGPDFFGLRKNTIAKMIQDLPNASKCSQYIWQTFEPARFNKPGRNRRRADSTLPGSLLGGVNYGLTSSRLIHNTNLTPTQQSYNRGTAESPPSSSPQHHHQQQQENNEDEEVYEEESSAASPRIHHHNSNNSSRSIMLESST